MSPRLELEYDQSRWFLKALRETAHELDSQLWGLDEDDLCRRPSDDAWSLKEVAAHLRDCEEHFLESLELITYGDAPRIPALDADGLVLERDYQQSDLSEVLERFAYLRHRTVILLSSLEPGDWERCGLHPYLGEVSIAQLTRSQNEHDLEHLWQARRLRQTLAEPAPSSL